MSGKKYKTKTSEKILDVTPVNVYAFFTNNPKSLKIVLSPSHTLLKFLVFENKIPRNLVRERNIFSCNISSNYSGDLLNRLYLH